jgi:hypothetical protein
MKFVLFVYFMIVINIVNEHINGDYGSQIALRLKRFHLTHRTEAQQFPQLLPLDFLIHIKGADDNMLDLSVNEKDDFAFVAEEFVDKHSLPRSLIPVLVNKIEEAVGIQDPAGAIVDDYCSSWQDSPDIDSSSDFGDQDLDERYSEVSYYQIKEAYSPRSSARSCRRPLSPLKSISPQRILSFSSPVRSSPSQGRTIQNQEFFDRMHDEGKRSVERRNRLRHLLQEDAHNTVRSSSVR